MDIWEQETVRIRTGLNHHASQSPGTRAPAAALDAARPAPEQPASDPVTLLELNYDGCSPMGWWDRANLDVGSSQVPVGGEAP